MCPLDRNINSWDRNAEKNIILWLFEKHAVSQTTVVSWPKSGCLLSIYSDLQINISFFW